MDIISWIFIFVFGIAFIIGVLLGIYDYVKSKSQRQDTKET